MPTLAPNVVWFCGWMTPPVNPRSESSVVLMTEPVTNGRIDARDCCRSVSARAMFVAARAAVGFFSNAWRITASNSIVTAGACGGAGVWAHAAGARVIVTTKATTALRMGPSRRIRWQGLAAPAARRDRSNGHIQDRNEDDGQERRREHAARDGGADGIARGRTGARRVGQREHAEDERERRHQNRPQADARSLDRGVDDGVPFLPQMLRELDDQNRVLRGEADEHDQADLAEDVVR